MAAKISISLTDEHARLLNEAVASGDYASSSEVIREALREWRGRRLLGQLRDEGVATGRATTVKPSPTSRKRPAVGIARDEPPASAVPYPPGASGSDRLAGSVLN
jgi:antitoxin ParD1/3/4